MTHAKCDRQDESIPGRSAVKTLIFQVDRGETTCDARWQPVRTVKQSE